MKKAALFVIVLAIILGVWYFKFGANLMEKPQGPKLVTLTYWSLGENEKDLRPLIESYQKAHPNVTINFVKQSPINYRTRVQTQVRAGQGPDVLEIHSSWLPMFINDLSTIPDSTMSLSDYTKNFYPLAKDTLVVNNVLPNGNKIYALPENIDGLALFVNTDILKAAGVSEPKTWPEFVDIARKVTVRNQEGQIQTAGASLGTADNVDYWPEILGLLFLQQPGTNLSAPGNQDGAEVLQFYTGFVTDPKNKTWDTTLPNSTQMFVDGRLAFYFAPSTQVAKIKAANPNLVFKTIMVPQLPGKNISYGSFWALGVSSKSSSNSEAWNFVKYLTSKEVEQYQYAQQVQVSSFGKPYARVELAEEASTDPIMGTFILSAPFYKGWYLNSYTQDLGLNDEMIATYKGAVDAVLQGKEPAAALNDISPGIKQVLEKYGVK